MENNLERWYSMKEITEYLGVSRDTVLDRIERRNMPAAKIGSDAHISEMPVANTAVGVVIPPGTY